MQRYDKNLNLQIFYFRNTKKTARTIQTKAAMWFHWRGVPLNKKVTMTVKMVREITSWITLSCIRLKGPPFPMNPIRLAGTVRQYSKKAIPQENKMIRMRGQPVEIFISCNLRWPYQANVINTFENTSIKMVQKPCIVNL